MKTEKCDACGDEVEVENDRFDDHNLHNYVRHIFISHPKDEDRIKILQAYVDRHFH